MSMTRFEQETIVNFNEKESMATIYTYNNAWIKKLRKLSSERSAECKFIKEQCGGYSFTVPKSWIKIRPRQILTDEEKQERAKRLKFNLQIKKSEMKESAEL